MKTNASDGHKLFFLKRPYQKLLTSQCLGHNDSESLLISFHASQSQKPGPYVKEMNDAATFYTNRVLKDYKET